jgi:hypothetical protein
MNYQVNQKVRISSKISDIKEEYHNKVVTIVEVIHSPSNPSEVTLLRIVGDESPEGLVTPACVEEIA